MIAITLVLPSFGAQNTAAKRPKTTSKTASITAGGVKVAFGPRGFTSVKVDGDEFLADGQPQVKSVRFTGLDGTAREREIGRYMTFLGFGGRLVTHSYKWGSVGYIYKPTANGVDIDATITNTSPDVLSGIMVQFLSLRPTGKTTFRDGVRAGSGVDSPTAVQFDDGKHTLAIVNEDLSRPLYAGFPAGDDKKPATTLPLLAATYHADIFPHPWLGAPHIDRPIYPGESDHLHISLRAARTPAGGKQLDLCRDVENKYAAAFPQRLVWKDRRPIGYLNLCTTAPHPDNGRNPRGWFNNDPAVDVTTDDGRKELGRRLLALADSSIPHLKATNAQGVIIWDSEGQEYPHAMSYIGDPRHLPPEMEPIADQFFQKFRDAGLRVGVCLRPQKPMKTVYGDVAEQVQVVDDVYNLNDKIAYAKKRWGCTLFYVDSNVHFDPAGRPDDEKAYELLPASLFEQAAKANPDVLLIPEQQTTRYYAYGAPYDELRQGTAATPESVRRVYPGSFTVISVATDTSGGPLDTRRTELVDAVRHGDILLFRAWYETPEMKPVQEIYRAAGR